ncbi:hypothetical protein FO519_008913 [Halicephalobus sp. NKZ332]|nr:hypothetical protein FO519_008913 [Halicephalobus sp. NKZ332]
MKKFSYLLLQCCCIDFLLSIITFIVKPVITIYESRMYNLTGGYLRAFGGVVEMLGITIWQIFFFFTICSMPVSFVFRYRVLCQNANISIKFYFSSLAISFLCASTFGIIVFFTQYIPGKDVAYLADTKLKWLLADDEGKVLAVSVGQMFRIASLYGIGLFPNVNRTPGLNGPEDCVKGYVKEFSETFPNVIKLVEFDDLSDKNVVKTTFGRRVYENPEVIHNVNDKYLMVNHGYLQGVRYFSYVMNEIRQLFDFHPKVKTQVEEYGNQLFISDTVSHKMCVHIRREEDYFNIYRPNLHSRAEVMYFGIRYCDSLLNSASGSTFSTWIGLLMPEEKDVFYNRRVFKDISEDIGKDYIDYESTGENGQKVINTNLLSSICQQLQKVRIKKGAETDSKILIALVDLLSNTKKNEEIRDILKELQGIEALNGDTQHLISQYLDRTS